MLKHPEIQQLDEVTVLHRVSAHPAYTCTDLIISDFRLYLEEKGRLAVGEETIGHVVAIMLTEIQRVAGYHLNVRRVLEIFNDSAFDYNAFLASETNKLFETYGQAGLDMLEDNAPSSKVLTEVYWALIASACRAHPHTVWPQETAWYKPSTNVKHVNRNRFLRTREA